MRLIHVLAEGRKGNKIMTIDLKANYDSAQASRMDAGMPLQSYEEYLESRHKDVIRRFEWLERRIVEYLDTQKNESLYRVEDGLGDEEIEMMQSRAQQYLFGVLKEYGWQLEPDDDGYYDMRVEVPDHVELCKRVRYGKMERGFMAIATTEDREAAFIAGEREVIETYNLRYDQRRQDGDDLSERSLSDIIATGVAMSEQRKRDETPTNESF